MPRRLIQSPEQLSVLLKTTRKARRLTQGALAAQVGVSTNRFSELEANVGELTVQRLLQLTRALGLELFVQNAGGPSTPPSDTSTPSW